jgi:hypothetical protein
MNRLLRYTFNTSAELHGLQASLSLPSVAYVVNMRFDFASFDSYEVSLESAFQDGMDGS